MTRKKQATKVPKRKAKKINYDTFIHGVPDGGKVKDDADMCEWRSAMDGWHRERMPLWACLTIGGLACFVAGLAIGLIAG